MSYENPRIGLHDTVMDIMVKMSDGNPGALTAMVSILQDGARIDPDDFFKGMGTLLHFDSADIYGSDIYVLWNDVCARNTTAMMGVMRASQLGITTDAEVRRMIRESDSAPVDNLLVQVRAKLPNFAK